MYNIYNGLLQYLHLKRTDVRVKTQVSVSLAQFSLDTVISSLLITNLQGVKRPSIAYPSAIYETKFATSFDDYCRHLIVCFLNHLVNQ